MQVSIESRSRQYGKVFDHWQIREFLGSGSGGKTAVFRLVRSDSSRGVSALKVINLIEARGETFLPEALRETAKMRLLYPEVSLEELGTLLDPPVGKSGVNHRLRRIEKLAKELDDMTTA